MRWLIVEDALRDRKGHWLEWVTTFQQGFENLGDQVTVLADAQVQPDIRDALLAKPILPPSIWHRMGDGSGALTRYWRVLSHAWKTNKVLGAYLTEDQEVDFIFVPTILVHHLLAWARLIKGPLRNRKTRVLLFFLTGPLHVDAETSRTSSDHSPTAKLMSQLLRWVAPEIRSGKVVLGVETNAMKLAMEEFSGLPFVWFPQPVSPLPARKNHSVGSTHRIEMACYGAARGEKGSDVLQQAISIYRNRYPASKATFTIQWVEDFVDRNGGIVTKLPELVRDPAVQFVTRYFVGTEYAEHLGETDVLLLPYRLASYRLRGSRVVVEAVVNGLPAVTTTGSTLAEVTEHFGAGLDCVDGDAESLVVAIRKMEAQYEEIAVKSQAKRSHAVENFSVAKFRGLFLDEANLASWPEAERRAMRHPVGAREQSVSP